MILINLMKKKDHWVPYIIDQVKGTKGLRGSSFSESNHSSVNFLSWNTRMVCMVLCQS